MRATTETGEPIPDALIERLQRGAPLQPGLRDGSLHGVGAGRHGGARAHVERAASTWSPSSAPSSSGSACRAAVGVNHRLVAFPAPVLGLGYAAGYYVYLWAEVLDADGFDAFVEAGDPFDPAVARRLARFIYSSGNSIEPGAAYRAFRGRAARRRSRCSGSAACSSRSRAERAPLIRRARARRRTALRRSTAPGNSRFSAAMNMAKSIGLVQ